MRQLVRALAECLRGWLQNKGYELTGKCEAEASTLELRDQCLSGKAKKICLPEFWHPGRYVSALVKISGGCSAANVREDHVGPKDRKLVAPSVRAG